MRGLCRPRSSRTGKSLAWLGLALVVQAIPAVAGPGPRKTVATTSDRPIAPARGPEDVSSRSEPRSSSAISTLSIIARAPVAGGGTGRVKAFCPSGMAAVGGGVDVGDLDDMVVTESAPSYGPDAAGDLLQQGGGIIGPPVAWVATVRNDGAAARRVDVAAICTDDPRVGTFVSAEQQVPADGTSSLIVICGSDLVCTGAGVAPSETVPMELIAAMPLVDGTLDPFSISDGSHEEPFAWVFEVRNSDAAERFFKAGVVFTRAGAGSFVTVIDSTPVPPGSPASPTIGLGSVTCPDGMPALSGGIASSDAAEMTVSSSGPVYGSSGERLFLQAEGHNPAPTGWRVTAINTGSGNSLKVAVVCDARSLDFFEGDDPDPDR